MIPKKIFTIWLSLGDRPIPELIKRCIESQKIPGYEHKLITISNCSKDSDYALGCLAKAQDLFREGDLRDSPFTNPLTWIVKAADFLRCFHIWAEGGIYLDADMEVLPGKNFDDLLDNRAFVGTDVFSSLACNAVFGAEAGHPFLREYLRSVEENFKAEGEMAYQPGVRGFADVVWGRDTAKEGIKICEVEMFNPYHHGTGKVNITPITKTYHHYAKSWAKEQWANKLNGDYYLKKVF
jgi:hypothetical protein